ncbi:hypothetical protein E3N88_37775 [Mikania micrantha]|uniref:Uncharacterized protein n=1 Tax=Mikania micrantha TaxID=192012 RepID=A0A5N6LS35_9ASTR|nr:hypothetical protein E3N88_37775 [Mikania micrantha]
MANDFNSIDLAYLRISSTIESIAKTGQKIKSIKTYGRYNLHSTPFHSLSIFAWHSFCFCGSTFTDVRILSQTPRLSAAGPYSYSRPSDGVSPSLHRYPFVMCLDYDGVGVRRRCGRS